MRLPKSIRDRLRQESHAVADMMATAPDLRRKLYVFSALFGEVGRALNQHWDRDLALAHLVLVSTHQNIHGRMSLPGPLNEDVPRELPDALMKTALEFAELFESPEQDEAKLYEILGELAEIAYAVTGNGYYLYLRGAFKL